MNINELLLNMNDLSTGLNQSQYKNIHVHVHVATEIRGEHEQEKKDMDERVNLACKRNVMKVMEERDGIQ